MQQTDKPLTLYVEVPFATFRESYSREYGKTYPVPPPATIYGMLLSLVGETDIHRHCGVQLAVAMLSKPRKSRILRQMRRFKQKGYSHPANSIPGYQEILSNLECLIWVDSHAEKEQPGLQARILAAFENPNAVKRFGCLFLGESDQLVKAIKLVSEDSIDASREWIVRNNRGRLTLPYWVDHVGSRNTRCLRYSIEETMGSFPPPNAWTVIDSPI